MRRESAGGIIFDKSTNKILLIQGNEPPNKWSLPKGHCNNGETNHAAAMREIYEETGLKVNLTSETPSMSIRRDHLKLYVIVIENVNEVYILSKQNYSIEVIDIQWKSYEDLCNLGDMANNSVKYLRNKWSTLLTLI